MTTNHWLSDNDAIGPSKRRREQISQIQHAPEQVASLVANIHDQALRESPHLKSGNFDAIHPSDLNRLFTLYDNVFFHDLLQRMLREDGAYPARMKLSRRLTRSAGQTVQRVHRDDSPPSVRYEIAVSTTLLFHNFRAPGREIVSSGLVCHDRLEALQRTFEHELLHLAEFLAWGHSNCTQPNFRALSQRIFAHESVHHELVTPRERAAVEFDVRVGDLVEFGFNGQSLRGVVNRITRRVTVLVPNPQGEPFSDGRRYLRYYVPMEGLRKLPHL